MVACKCISQNVCKFSYKLVLRCRVVSQHICQLSYKFLIDICPTRAKFCPGLPYDEKEFKTHPPKQLTPNFLPRAGGVP